MRTAKTHTLKTIKLHLPCGKNTWKRCIAEFTGGYRIERIDIISLILLRTIELCLACLISYTYVLFS